MERTPGPAAAGRLEAPRANSGSFRGPHLLARPQDPADARPPNLPPISDRRPVRDPGSRPRRPAWGYGWCSSPKRTSCCSARQFRVTQRCGQQAELKGRARTRERLAPAGRTKYRESCCSAALWVGNWDELANQTEAAQRWRESARAQCVFSVILGRVPEAA